MPDRPLENEVDIGAVRSLHGYLAGPRSSPRGDSEQHSVTFRLDSRRVLTYDQLVPGAEHFDEFVGRFVRLPHPDEFHHHLEKLIAASAP